MIFFQKIIEIFSKLKRRLLNEGPRVVFYFDVSQNKEYIKNNVLSFSRNISILKATIMGSSKDRRQVSDKELLKLKEQVMAKFSEIFSGKILDEIKKDMEKLIHSKERKKGIIPFYEFPLTLFHMVKYAWLHHTMKSRGFWSKGDSEKLFKNKIDFLMNFEEVFEKFSIKNQGPEYLLKFFAFIGIELTLLGIKRYERMIDDKIISLTKEDHNFRRYFDYKLFLLKQLVFLAPVDESTLKIKNIIPLKSSSNQKGGN